MRDDQKGQHWGWLVVLALAVGGFLLYREWEGQACRNAYTMRTVSPEAALKTRDCWLRGTIPSRE